jgi:phage-related minor tail protein
MAKVLGFSINIQGTERAVETAEELRRAIASVRAALKQTEDVQSIKILEKQLTDLRASQQDVNAQIREEIKLRRTELNAVDDASGAYAKMSKTLNDQRKRYKDLAAAGQEFTKEALDIRTEITQLDARLKDIDASVGQFQRNVGGYSQALSQFFPRITQRFGEVQTGFASTAGAAGALNKSLTVLLIAVTVFNEVGAAITAATEASKEFTAVSKRLVQTTRLTGDALKDNVGTIIALSRVYQQESNEIVNAANTVAKEFGIEYSEALALIEAGFRKGANAQGDFLSQLREYPAQFAAAGGSAASFFDILIRAQNEGIYSDKGIDAVKEFGLRIREQTTSTKAALENAFGQKFTSDLFRGINNGSITTVDALKRVATGLRDTQLTAEQTQRVIADTFGGPGEDAGLRFLKLLADIDTATKDVTESTNQYESQQYKLFLANEELAQSQARLAEFTVKTGAEYELLRANFKIFLTGVATQFLEFFNRLPATLAGAGAAIKAFNESVRAISTFGLVGDITNPFKAYNTAYKVAIKEIRAQDEIALAENEKRQAQAAEESAKAAKGQGEKVGKSFIEGSIAALQQKANALQKAITESVAGSEAQAKLIAAYKVQEKLLEDAIAARNRLELQGIREQQTQAVQAIDVLARAVIPARIEFERNLQKTIRELNLKGAKEQNKQYLQQLAERRALEKLEQQQRKEQTIAFVQQGVSETFNLINAITAAGNQRRNEVFAQQISDTEMRIAEIETRAQQATGIRKRLFEQQAASEKKILEKQRQDAEAEQKKQRKAEKRNALIVSVIQGVLAVQRALANPPGPPFTIPQAVATGIFSALQTATIAAQPLATGGIAGISGRKVNDRQNMRTRSNGDNVLATVKRGEVVLNQRQQAALGGADTFRAIRVPGFASGGIASPSISAPRLPVAAADSMKAIQALDRKTDAINARLDRVKVFVVTEDIARDMAEGEAIQAKATL